MAGVKEPPGERLVATFLRRPKRFQFFDGLVPRAQDFRDLALFRKRREKDGHLLVRTNVEMLERKPALIAEHMPLSDGGVRKFGEIFWKHYIRFWARDNKINAVCIFKFWCNNTRRARRA